MRFHHFTPTHYCLSKIQANSEKLEELIEIKDKLIIDQPATLELSMPKLVGADVPQDNGQDTIYDGDENSEIGKAITAAPNIPDSSLSLSRSAVSIGSPSPFFPSVIPNGQQSSSSYQQFIAYCHDC
ncbi:hypothetical protein QL285_071279 [Trifolium repens]|nr:hypothetical protein QL285_071279 [Trifolium repens]